jgi:gluconate 5-dehydrogenase
MLRGVSTIFPDKFRLDGRTALVTGSGQGLGWEMAKGLAEAGAKVILHGRTREKLEPRLADLQGASAIAFDMADRAAMREAMAKAPAIDILVHNVGARDRRSFTEIEPDDFDRLIDIDLNAAHALVKLVLPHMQKQRWGRLIMVTSIVAHLATRGSASYTAAKGGLAALTRVMANELGADGITCNAIAPGFFATETNAELIASPLGERMRERAPAKRWAEPWEIAGAALYLASPAAAYVNGHTLTVDGGVSASYMA